MKKTVLITGGAGGIGAACARRMSQCGYNLIIAYRQNEQGARQLQAELKDKCDVILARGDIADSGFVRQLFSIRVDALINNAGISCIALVHQTTDNMWEDVLRTDLSACFYTCREAIGKMRERSGGAIVNISSMWGQTGAACESAYSAAKAGVIGLTKALAKEAGPSGVRVNCVCPGVIDTPMNAELSAQTIELLKRDTPLGRIGTPEEVAYAVAFLLGDDASFITGQVLGVNGGLVI